MMTHIDEHILELYLLGDEKALLQKKVIEQHLSECRGCRELAQKMQSFYEDVRVGTNENIEEATPSVASMMAIREHESHELWQKPKLPIAARWSVIERWSPAILKSFWLNVGNFAYHRPVTASLCSLAVIAALILFIKTNVSSTFRNSNPSYFNYNTGESKIEIYNARNQLLWSIPSNNLADNVKNEVMPQTYIVDLDNDGSQEIVTCLPVAYHRLPVLTVFNADGNQRFQFDFPSEEISFRTKRYSLKPRVNSIVPINHSNVKGCDIVVESVTGRSPNFIARLSSNGELLGKMWYCGGLSYLTADTLFRKPMIIAAGIYDVDEESRGIAYLVNPEKIVGETESLASAGFGFPVAVCEKMIIRFPSCDMYAVLHVGQFVMRINKHIPGVMGFDLFPYPNQNGPAFEFFCNDSLQFNEVKPSDVNTPIHSNLKSQGIIHSILNKQYHEDLKNGVRYWNGASWQREWTMLNQ
jgi:hypothetical protein